MTREEIITSALKRFEKKFPHTLVDNQGRPRLLIRTEKEHKRLKDLLRSELKKAYNTGYADGLSDYGDEPNY